MTEITLQPYDASYRAWAQQFMADEWGTAQQVSRGVLYNVIDYPGFVALLDGQPSGLVTYTIDDAQCEVLMIHSAVEGVGAGTALMDKVIETAREAGCERVWLITTNDNIPALRWYQMRGFDLVTVHRNALRKSRKLKPDIPKTGLDGIPLRDEIELEMRLV